MKKLMKIKPLISALEPRILFDGAAVVTAVDALDNTSFDTTTDTTTEDTSDVSTVTEAFSEEKSVDTSLVETSTDTTEIYFIDSSVDDYESIVESLEDDAEVYIIDSESDGLEQIADILEDMDDIDAIHIISHGDVGKITIGGTVLTEESIEYSSDILEAIGESLSDEGDILLYGCSVAEDGEGEAFVDAFAQATSADVAASNDITGAQTLGGDWDLEYESGVVDADYLNFEDYNNTLVTDSIVTKTSSLVTKTTSLSGGSDGEDTVYFSLADFGLSSTDTITGIDSITISDDSSTFDTYEVSRSITDSSVSISIYEGASGIGNITGTVTLSISYESNAEPTQLTIGTQTLSEDFSSYTIDLNNYFDDAETEDANLTYTVAGNAHIGVSIDKNGIATISSATQDWNGSETITFTATDEADQSVSQDVTFNVSEVNDTPEIQVFDVTGSIEEGVTLTDSGTITFSDVDLTDTIDTSVKSSAVRSDDITLTTEQIAAISSAFSVSAASDNSNDGTINWVYDIDESELDFLAEGEVVTATFTIAVDDGNSGIATQDIIVTITGSNDAVVASTDDVNFMEQPFGTDFIYDTSTYFSDVDSSDEMTFRISGLPNGLTYDADTGIISGTLEDIGSFTITITADDQSSGVSSYLFNDSSSATKVFLLDILAPATTVTTTAAEAVTEEVIEAVEVEPEIASGASGNELTQESSEDSAAVREVRAESEAAGSEKSAEDIASFIVLNRDASDLGVEGVVRSADVTVNVDASGQVTFNDTTESVDFSLQSINLSADNTVTIDIRDDNGSEQDVYSASYGDGQALPEELSLDSLTGQISGTIPDYMIDADGNIEIEISAYNPITNETRILKIKMNINDLKESVSSASDAAYVPFSEQLEMANEKLNNYGDELSKLFSDSVA